MVPVVPGSAPSLTAPSLARGPEAVAAAGAMAATVVVGRTEGRVVAGVLVVASPASRGRASPSAARGGSGPADAATATQAVGPARSSAASAARTTEPEPGPRLVHRPLTGLPADGSLGPNTWCGALSADGAPAAQAHTAEPPEP